MFLFSLKTSVQPVLPKYLPSHFKFISLGTTNLGSTVGVSKYLWKLRVNVLSDIPGTLRAFKGTPEETHVLKNLKYLCLLFIFLRVKVLKQTLHLNLTNLFDTPHLIQNPLQNTHFWDTFFYTLGDTSIISYSYKTNIHFHQQKCPLSRKWS